MGKYRAKRKSLPTNPKSTSFQTSRPDKKVKIESTPINSPKSRNKRKRRKSESNSKPAKHNRPNSPVDVNGGKSTGKEADQEFAEIDSLAWSEVICPDSVFLGDDLGGFLCLEEIDGVDVEYKGND